MTLLNHVKYETTQPIYYFETLHNAYDNDNTPIEYMDIINVNGRRYTIDDKITTEYSTTVYAHKYDTVRKIKHELIFVIDWNNLHYHYELKKFDIA